jgi:hypothetical protein
MRADKNNSRLRCHTARALALTLNSGAFAPDNYFAPLNCHSESKLNLDGGLVLQAFLGKGKCAAYLIAKLKRSAPDCKFWASKLTGAIQSQL